LLLQHRSASSSRLSLDFPDLPGKPAGEPLLKKQIRDSETLRKKFETLRPKETHEKRDFMTRYKSSRDSEIGSNISEIHDFLDTIRHP